MGKFHKFLLELHTKLNATSAKSHTPTDSFIISQTVKESVFKRHSSKNRVKIYIDLPFLNGVFLEQPEKSIFPKCGLQHSRKPQEFEFSVTENCYGP